MSTNEMVYRSKSGTFRKFVRYVYYGLRRRAVVIVRKVVDRPGRIAPKIAPKIASKIASKSAEKLREKLRLIQFNYAAARPFFAVYRQGLFAEAMGARADELKAECYISLLPSSLPAAFELNHMHPGRVFCDNVENVDIEKHSFAPAMCRSALRMVNDLARGGMQRCDGLLTVGTELEKTLKSFNKPTFVLRNFRQYEEPRGSGELRRRCGIGNEDILLFASGNVVVGFEPVLRALCRLPENFHLAAFVRLKPLPYEKQMLDLVAELGLKKRVHFFPFVDYKMLAQTAADADIGLITSDITNPNGAVGLPNRCFDYLTAGLPIVAPAMPDVRDLVNRYGFGRIVATTSEEAWAENIRIVVDGIAHFRQRAIEARRALTWESQEVSLYEFLGKPGSVTLIGFRDLSRYQRYLRLSRTLKKFGCRVNVVFFSEDPKTFDLVNGVDYYYTSDRYGVGPGLIKINRAPAIEGVDHDTR